MAAEPGTNQSVERAATVLGAFTAGRPLRVSDVAKAAGLGQSTASRLLSTLEGIGFVERDPGSALYQLGPALITLAGVAVNQHPVHREARQPAQQLAATLGLGVNVAVRREASVFYLCNFEGALAPKSYALMGHRNPLHATGLGKCLLAGVPAEERRTLLPVLDRFTAATITSHDALDDAVAAVDQVGYTHEVEELALGRACVAAPIRGTGGEVVAAISISGPLSAVDLGTREATLAQTLIEVADSIGSGLGYLGPRHAAELAPSRRD